MRTAGTIYEAIDRLPPNAMPVSVYARQQDIAVGQVYMKYKRSTEGYENGTIGPHPGYTIRSFYGMNYVIPD